MVPIAFGIYPTSETVRLKFRIIKSDFDVKHEKLLNEQVNDSLEDSYMEGEQNVLHVIETIKDCHEKVAVLAAEARQEETQRPSSASGRLLRYYIYSHHIYSKTKRKNICLYANEKKLFGFSKPGKPGVIVIEGDERYVKEWWRIVRSWNWQHIEVKHEEFVDEIIFDSPVKELESTDLSDLNKLLLNKGLDGIFKRFFGVDGRLKEGDATSSVPQPAAPPASTANNSEALRTQSSQSWARFWIWTHHVYNGAKRDEKRKSIITLARDMKLAGFTVPCKPGYILVEGERSQCEKYYKEILSWGWREMRLQHTEENLKFADLKFQDSRMEELTFCLSQTNTIRKNSLDAGKLREYLEGKGLAHVFKGLFKLGEFEDS